MMTIMLTVKIKCGYLKIAECYGAARLNTDRSMHEASAETNIAA